MDRHNGDRTTSVFGRDDTGQGRASVAMISTLKASARRWRVPLSIGVLDQAVVSGANFGLSIALARWLPPAEYGAFAVAFALLLLIGGPYSALLPDALAVVGPRHFRGHGVDYFRTLLVLHTALTIPIGALFAAATLLPSSARIVAPVWLAALGLGIVLVLLPWLLRGVCYLEMRPGVALAGSICYAITLVLLLAGSHRRSWLSGPVALVLMSVASACASLWMAASLGLLRRPWRLLDASSVAKKHWAYGRWIIGASMAHGTATGLYAPLVATVVGLEQAAVLRALQNLLLPVQQVLTGIGRVAYPSMSHRVVEFGPQYLRRRGPAFLAGGVGVATIYGLAVTSASHPLLRIMYGPGLYTDHAALVPLIALTAVVTALAQGLGILVRVLDRPQVVLWSKMAAAAWLVVPGILLVRTSGVSGALWGLAIGTFLEALVLLVALPLGGYRESGPQPSGGKTDLS